MPSSYAQIAVHIVFGLKSRQRYLNDEIHHYIHGIITNIKGVPIQINGTEDHIHILSLLPRDLSIADFVKTIKANSSKWHNSRHEGKIFWQTGYAAFSVSKTNVGRVQEYIIKQKEHHKAQSFEDEMKKFLSDKEGREVLNEWFKSLEDAE